MIKGKTPEEIRKLFNIVNDFTPEEEVRDLFFIVCRLSLTPLCVLSGPNQEGERKFRHLTLFITCLCLSFQEWAEDR
jgi:hypothetical protein